MSTPNTGAVGAEKLECILPYVRKKLGRRNEAWFVYDKEHTTTTTKTITKQGTRTSTTVKEKVVEMREQKVKLLTYGQTAEEDSECFFEVLEKFKLELASEWEAASAAQGNDATVLFDGISHCLIGTALANWLTVLGTENSRTWKTFKTKMAEYICTKVLGKDAYNVQRRYLSMQMKPSLLSFTEWSKRMETVNRYLPYMFSSLEDLKQHYPAATFSDWWILGSLSDDALRTLIFTRVPPQYYRQLQRADLNHSFRNTATIQDICETFDTYDISEQQPSEEMNEFEIEYRAPAQRIPGGPVGSVHPGTMNPYYRRRGAVPPTTYSTGTAYQQHYNNHNQQQQQEFQPQSQRYNTGRSNGQWIDHGGAQSHGGAQFQHNSEQQPTMRPNQHSTRSGVYFQQQQNAPAMEQESPQVETTDDGQVDQYATMEEAFNAWNNHFWMDDVIE